MNEKELRLHKILSSADAVVSLLVIVGIMLYFTGLWKDALDVCIPLLGISLSISGFRLRKSQHTISIICFCAAAFIFLCCIGVFLI